MIFTQWLKLSLSVINIYGHKEVGDIKVRLYKLCVSVYKCIDKVQTLLFFIVAFEYVCLWMFNFRSSTHFYDCNA